MGVHFMVGLDVDVPGKSSFVRLDGLPMIAVVPTSWHVWHASASQHPSEHALGPCSDSEAQVIVQ